MPDGTEEVNGVSDWSCICSTAMLAVVLSWGVVRLVTGVTNWLNSASGWLGSTWPGWAFIGLVCSVDVVVSTGFGLVDCVSVCTTAIVPS